MWTLTELPTGKKAAICKRVFRVKPGGGTEKERYKVKARSKVSAIQNLHDGGKAVYVACGVCVDNSVWTYKIQRF